MYIVYLTEHESGDVEKAKNETLATNTDDGCTTAGSNERSNEKNEIKDMGKSSVISLKTNIKKSYDDLPDLGGDLICFITVAYINYNQIIIRVCCCSTVTFFFY